MLTVIYKIYACIYLNDLGVTSGIFSGDLWQTEIINYLKKLIVWKRI